MSGTSKEVNSPRRSIKDRLGPRSSDDKFIRHKSLGDDYSKSSQRHKEVCIQYVVFTLFVWPYVFLLLCRQNDLDRARNQDIVVKEHQLGQLIMISKVGRKKQHGGHWKIAGSWLNSFSTLKVYSFTLSRSFKNMIHSRMHEELGKVRKRTRR